MDENIIHGVNKEISIDLTNRVTLNKDYELLINKPSINNVELIGNKTLNELSILSNNSAVYNETTLKSANKADFLLLTNDNKETKKMKLGEISSHLIHTVESIPEDLEVGNYVFLLKEEKNNGTNKK